MSTGQRFVERWPELFAGLSERQVTAAVHALAMTWADGVDEPGYEDVKALTDVPAGRYRIRSIWRGRGNAPVN